MQFDYQFQEYHPVSHPIIPTAEQDDQPAWSFKASIIGLLLTLVPWLLFNVVIYQLLGSKAQNQPTQQLSTGYDAVAAIITFIISTLIEGAFLIAPLICVFAFSQGIKRGLRGLGFRGTRFWVSAGLVFLGFILAIAVNYIYSEIIYILHANIQTNDQVIQQTAKAAPLSTLATLAVAVFVAPVCEEIFFRGFVMQGLKAKVGAAWAIVLSAVIFGISHFDLGSLPVLIALGFLLGFLRWKTKSIWPGITLHALNNGLGALAIIMFMLSK